MNDFFFFLRIGKKKKKKNKTKGGRMEKEKNGKKTIGTIYKILKMGGGGDDKSVGKVKTKRKLTTEKQYISQAKKFT